MTKPNQFHAEEALTLVEPDGAAVIMVRDRHAREMFLTVKVDLLKAIITDLLQRFYRATTPSSVTPRTTTGPLQAIPVHRVDLLMGQNAEGVLRMVTGCVDLNFRLENSESLRKLAADALDMATAIDRNQPAGPKH